MTWATAIIIFQMWGTTQCYWYWQCKSKSKDSFPRVQFIKGVVGWHLFIFFPALGLLTLIMTQKLFAELWCKIISQFPLYDNHLGIWWRPPGKDRQLLTNHPVGGWGVKLTKDDNQDETPRERIAELFHCLAKVFQRDPPVIFRVKDSAQYWLKVLAIHKRSGARNETWMHRQDPPNPLSSHVVCWSSDWPKTKLRICRPETPKKVSHAKPEWRNWEYLNIVKKCQNLRGEEQHW